MSAHFIYEYILVKCQCLLRINQKVKRLKARATARANHHARAAAKAITLIVISEMRRFIQ